MGHCYDYFLVRKVLHSIEISALQSGLELLLFLWKMRVDYLSSQLVLSGTKNRFDAGYTI